VSTLACRRLPTLPGARHTAFDQRGEAVASNALLKPPFGVPTRRSMTYDQHLAVEVAQFLQHVHDIADLLADRMIGLSEAEAEALLEQELVRLAVLAKQLEAKTGTPELASSVGYKVSAVIRTRVAAALKR
jgi:hypothetical protein